MGVWSVVAGVARGTLYLTRPFDAALLGSAAALWAWGVGDRRLSLPSLATIAVVSLGVAALMFAHNRALTGDASVPPFPLWAANLFGPGVDVIGFGPNVGIPMWRNIDPLPGHGPADAVLNANKNLTLMNFGLFGWATGSLILAALACVLGPWRRGDGPARDDHARHLVVKSGPLPARTAPAGAAFPYERPLFVVLPANP